MNKTLTLCESYSFIDYTLHTLTNLSGDVPSAVLILGFQDLYKFFQIINAKVFDNNLELIYCPPYAPKRVKARGIRKILYFFPDILGERRHLKRFYDRYLKSLMGAEVTFESPGFTGAKIYLLVRLAKKNRLVFMDPGPPRMSKYSPRSIRDLATLLIYKIIYGKDVNLGQFPIPWQKGFPLLSEYFMKNSVDSVIDWSNRTEIMKGFDWGKYSVFNSGDYRVIYFHQDLVGEYVPDRDVFSQELKSIFDVVLRHFPENEISRKYHPGHDLNKDVIEVGEELPAYIPAEFLYDDRVKVYLSIYSNAIANVRGGQAISLIYLISFNDNHIREGFRDFLVKLSSTAILFPKSLGEFEQMLKNIK